MLFKFSVRPGTAQGGSRISWQKSELQFSNAMPRIFILECGKVLTPRLEKKIIQINSGDHRGNKTKNRQQ
jgi:hypothetical protein